MIDVQFPASEKLWPANLFPQTFPTNLETLKETWKPGNQSLFTNATLLTNYLNPKTNSIFLLSKIGGIII